VREVLPGQRPRADVGPVPGQLGEVGRQCALRGGDHGRRRARDQARGAQDHGADADGRRRERYEREPEHLHREQDRERAARRQVRPQASSPPRGGEQGQAREAADEPRGPGVAGLFQRDQGQRDGGDALTGPRDEGRGGQGGEVWVAHSAILRAPRSGR
jgi:hypothetical protein